MTINITYMGCAAPLKPHFDVNGTCLCELPSNLSVGSPEMTRIARLPPRAEVTETSGPLLCTPCTIAFGSLGEDRPGTTFDLSYVEPFKPHYYANGVCLCESSSGPDDISAEITRTLSLSLLDGITKSMSYETGAGIREPYPPFRLEITGNCRVEQKIDLPEQSNNGDLIRNHTRYVCITGSFLSLLKTGTRDCIKPHTMLSTAHVGSGEITKMTFSTVHLTGQGPSADTRIIRCRTGTARAMSVRFWRNTTASTCHIDDDGSVPTKNDCCGGCPSLWHRIQKRRRKRNALANFSRCQ
jgi:hypothetical protein